MARYSRRELDLQAETINEQLECTGIDLRFFANSRNGHTAMRTASRTTPPFCSDMTLAIGSPRECSAAMMEAFACALFKRLRNVLEK